MLHRKTLEVLWPVILFFFKILFVCILRQRRREKGRERNINVWLPLVRPVLGTWPATQANTQTGNRNGDPLVRKHSIHSATPDKAAYSLIFFKRFYLFVLERRKEEKERERNINVWLPLAHPPLGTWPATQACALSGN